MTAGVGDAPFEVVFGHALRGEECFLRSPGRPPVRVPIENWTGGVDAGDRILVDHCRGATLDVGCGPGRLTAELASRGHVVLGIDVTREAVGRTVRRGVTALRRDVFARVPGEGRWRTALLADGNIGIGGDPAALLARVRQLVDPRGRVVVEVAGPGIATVTLDARLECSCRSTSLFAWAIVGLDDLPRLAARAGLAVQGVDHYASRWSAVLVAPR